MEWIHIDIISYSNMTSFFRFASKQAIYLDGKVSLAQNKIIYTVVNVLIIYFLWK